MHQEEIIDSIRRDFQERVGNLCLSPWTITAEEAEQLRNKYSRKVILTGFSMTGQWIKRQKENLLFPTQEDVMFQLYRRLSGVSNENQQYRRPTPRTRKPDYGDSMKKAPLVSEAQ